MLLHRTSSDRPTHARALLTTLWAFRFDPLNK
jgi:hypothetical protein